MDLGLSGKRALVSGSTTGIGYAIAATLARLGDLGAVDAGAPGARLLDPTEAQVVLGIALAARAPRLGHVCLDLATLKAVAKLAAKSRCHLLVVEELPFGVGDAPQQNPGFLQPQAW